MCAGLSFARPNLRPQSYLPLVVAALLTTAKAAKPTVYGDAKSAMRATLLLCHLRIDLSQSRIPRASTWAPHCLDLLGAGGSAASCANCAFLSSGRLSQLPDPPQ